MNYLRDELEDIAGEQSERYYHSWLLTVILWRALWWGSTGNWKRYRLTIWDIFSSRLLKASRMGRGVNGFLAQAAREFQLILPIGNETEREIIMELLALPDDKQRQIIRQFREDLPAVIAFFRKYRDNRKAELEEQKQFVYEVS